MKYYNLIELKLKSNEIIQKGWIECESLSTGNVGLLLEKLLGLENHNFSIPDYGEIEIKTKTINSLPHITLFNATPDSHLFVIKRIHDAYGYPDKDNKNFKVFNLSFYANTETRVNRNIYAKLIIDRSNKKIILNFYDRKGNINDYETSWSFELLEEKLYIKLKLLFLMYAERKFYNKKCYCRYLKYNFFKYRGFSSFLKAFEDGHIRVTFTIGVFKSGSRFGQIHDHGTSFDIDLKNIEKVFIPII